MVSLSGLIQLILPQAAQLGIQLFKEICQVASQQDTFWTHYCKDKNNKKVQHLAAL